MSNVQKYLHRLSNKEDGFTERKPEGAGGTDFKKAIVAFANSIPENSEAILFIGVDDNGNPLGVKNTDSLQKSLRQLCEKNCYPPVPHQSIVFQIDGKDILAVIIPHSTKRPHFAGHAYVRVGSESVIASDKLFQEMLDSRTSKVREILNWKDKPITKEVHFTLCGTPNIDIKEMIVEFCNSHYIRMRDTSSDRYESLPISKFEICYDEKRNRLKLLIIEGERRPGIR